MANKFDVVATAVHTPIKFDVNLKRRDEAGNYPVVATFQLDTDVTNAGIEETVLRWAQDYKIPAEELPGLIVQIAAMRENRKPK